MAFVIKRTLIKWQEEQVKVNSDFSRALNNATKSHYHSNEEEFCLIRHSYYFSLVEGAATYYQKSFSSS